MTQIRRESDPQHSLESNHRGTLHVLTLHGAESVGRAADLLKNDKSLAAHLQGLEGHDVQYLAKLGENGVEGLLQVLLLDLLIEIVDVDGVVGPIIDHGSETCGFLYHSLFFVEDIARFGQLKRNTGNKYTVDVVDNFQTTQ